MGRGRPKNPPKVRDLLKKIIPVEDMFEPEELTIYNSLVDLYLEDLEEEDLTSSDMQDIMTLATNKILEIRMLKGSKGSADKQLDFSNALEKLVKANEKKAENLLTRRKDRIDPNKYKGFSIVDLAVAYDEDKKKYYEERIKQNRKEEEEALERRKDYTGNKFDIDVNETEKEDDVS